MLRLAQGATIMNARVLLVAAAVLPTVLPGQEVQVALLAIEPIEARWVNAPPGTVGAIDSRPAGLLSNASVGAPVGDVVAQFACDLTCSDGVWTLSASSEVVLGVTGGLYAAHADLLLAVWADLPGVVAIEVEASHLGDSAQPSGFAVDLDADGSAEVTMFHTMLNSRHHATLPLDGDLRVIRIRSDNAPASPQRYDLELRVRPWLPAGSAAAPDCGGRSMLQSVYGPVFVTNHQLALLPTDAPGALGRLVAHGLGAFQLFLVGQAPAMVPWTPPLPFSGTCPMLADPSFVLPGTALATWPGWFGTYAVDIGWQVVVPPLPPGLELYVQSLSANAVPPASFGLSNVVRIDS